MVTHQTKKKNECFREKYKVRHDVPPFIGLSMLIHGKTTSFNPTIS